MQRPAESAKSAEFGKVMCWNDLLARQVAPTRALKRLSFLVQLLRFFEARAY
jgi:hypothetical protein